MKYLTLHNAFKAIIALSILLFLYNLYIAIIPFNKPFYYGGLFTNVITSAIKSILILSVIPIVLSILKLKLTFLYTFIVNWMSLSTLSNQSLFHDFDLIFTPGLAFSVRLIVVVNTLVMLISLVGIVVTLQEYFKVDQRRR